jgi:hypothetical protein
VNALKKTITIVMILFLIASIIWFLNRNVSEGYVFSNNSKGSCILVISLDDSEAEGKTKEEVISILDIKASKYKGTVYDMPFINKVLKADDSIPEFISLNISGETQIFR